MELKDSGSRREFESGAVRDIQAGKGRCDLLPLRVIALKMRDATLDYIGRFMETGNTSFLFDAVDAFLRLPPDPCREGDAERREGWADAMLDVSLHYEAGCEKYGERNWEKGIPVHCYIDSGVRHYLKHLRGDCDENHGRAFVWNMLGAVWTCWNRPELIDIPGATREETLK